MVGPEVGYLVGGTVSPGTVGTEVVGYLEGADEGSEVGRLEVGRTVGWPEGCMLGVTLG
jgi:hypothetical protein